MKTLAVIGLGHIGGTLAKSLKKVMPELQVLGVDANPEHGSVAQAAGWVDEVASLQTAVPQADWVALAIPVQAMRGVLPRILELLSPKALVFDLGSTKAALCEAVAQHPRRGRYVAAHPIAGTENSGPTAAMDDLFQGKKMVLCETECSDPDAVQEVKTIFESLEMDILYMQPREHDVHLAYISHLSHLTSFSLALSVLRAERNEDLIVQFAGSGFASTARLGKSSPEMWSAIFQENKQPLLQVLKTYQGILDDFRQAIEQEDVVTLNQYMNEANEIRRILE